MPRFSKRSLAQAIGEAFRAPFTKRPARPERRRPLFEPLEPRVLLSAEIPVVPPSPIQQTALVAPLEFGTDAMVAAQIAAQQQAPRTVQFQEGFDSAQLNDGAELTLDFSAVASNLSFKVRGDGSVTVSDGASEITASNVVKLIGGAGDDRFSFEALPEQPLQIETGGRGNDMLDFSALRDDLTYTTHTDGSLTVSDGGARVHVTGKVSAVGSQGRNTFVEEKAPVIAGTLNGGVFSAAASQLSLAAYLASQPAPKQIVIIDPSVSNYQSLLQGIVTGSQSSASPSASTAGSASADSPAPIAGADAPAASVVVTRDEALVLVLDSSWDGVEQITQLLAAYQGLAAVHIVSHGANGSVRLGNNTLNSARLETLSDRLRVWGHSLADYGDLLLYGCNVANTEAGVQFVRDLSELTGADVAASTDATGAAALGGDWELEASTGVIDVAALSSADYGFLLAALTNSGTGGADNFIVTNTNYSLNGGAAVSVGTGDSLALSGGNGNDNFEFQAYSSSNTAVTVDGQANTDTVDLSDISTQMYVKIDSAAAVLTVNDGDAANDEDELYISNVETIILGNHSGNTLDLSSITTGELRVTVSTDVTHGNAVLIERWSGSAWNSLFTIKNVEHIKGGGSGTTNHLVVNSGAVTSIDVAGYNSKANALAGLEALAGLVDRVEDSSKLDISLFLLDSQSLGDVYDIGGVLRTKIAGTISALSSAPTLYEILAALKGISGVTATGSNTSGAVSIDIVLDVSTVMSVDLSLGEGIEQVLKTNALRGDVSTRLQWSFRAAETSGGSFSATSQSNLTLSADLNKTSFVGNSGFLGLNFTSPTQLLLDADVTVNTGGISGESTTDLTSFNAATLSQSGIANARVNLQGNTTVAGVSVTLPSGLNALASVNGGATVDLFTSPSLTASNNFTAAGIAEFAKLNAGDVFGQLDGFADFLAVFSGKALELGLPLSEAAKTFADVLELEPEFRENFLALVQVQALTSATLVSTLNNGGGLRTVSGNDFKVTLSNGTTFNVDLSASDTTMGQVASKIQTASGSSTTGTFEARLDPITGGLALVDRTNGVGVLTVEVLNQSFAARDLGLLAEATRNFDRNTLARDLNGGTGVRTVAGNDFSVTIGTTTFNVDLNATAAEATLAADVTLGDLVKRIQDSAPASLTAQDWEVAIDAANFRLQILDKTPNPDVLASTAALNSSNARTDLKINSGNAGAPRIIAQNIGFRGANFTSVQELLSRADAGASTAIGGFQYDTSGTPTLKFTATVNIGGAGDMVTDDVALFDIGALTGTVTTGGTVTLTPTGTLTLPFEFQLTTIGAGFSINANSPLSALNRGLGVDVRTGADLVSGVNFKDIQVRLSDGITTFDVDLEHDASSITLASLGFTTGGAGNDVTVTLRDGKTFGVDLDGGSAPTTIGGLVTALNAAYAALNPTETEFTAQVHQARGSLVLIDSTTGGGTFSVDAPAQLSALETVVSQVLDGKIQRFTERSFFDLGDLIDKIKAAATAAGITTARFDIGIAPGNQGLIAYDGTNGGNTFEVVGLNDSPAKALLGLTASGSAPAITNDTLVADLNRTGSIGTTGNSNPDITITLKEGPSTTFSVDLDGASTVGILMTRIQDAANSALGGVNQTKFKVGFPIGSTTPSLFDYTTGGGTFTVANAAGSTAATLLGLTALATPGADANSVNAQVKSLRSQTRVITGDLLHDDASSSHAGLRGATVAASVAAAGSGISGTALWGPTEVAIAGGSSTGNTVFNFVLADSGFDAVDSFASFRELRSGLADVTGLIGSTGGFSGTPSGSVSVTLPMTVSPGITGLTHTATLDISSANVFSQSAPTVAFSSSNTTTEFLNDVSQLTVDQVLTTLESGAAYLQQLQNSNASLSSQIAGLNRSLGQLLPFGDSFDTLADTLRENTPRSLQELATALGGLGFTGVGFTYDGTGGAEALHLGLTYSPAQTSSQRFHLNLDALGVDLAAAKIAGIGSIVDFDVASPISVTATGAINLRLGVDLANASHAGFVSDTTSLSFGVSAPQTDLNFSALLGARTVDIVGGSFYLDADGSGGSTAAATYTVNVTDDSDGRRSFAEAAGVTTGSFSGRMDATLPIVWPLDLNHLQSNTVTASAGAGNSVSVSNLVGGETVLSILTSTPLGGNVNGLRAGFKELMRLLDYAFDAAIFSKELPFVGTQLVQSADFLMQIRDKVGDNFDFITGILTADKAEQALLDAFGPGGLNWLKDRNNDGAVNIEDIVVTAISGGDSGTMFDLLLEAPQMLLEIPVELDLILPGLGLRVDARARVNFGFSMPLKFGISTGKGVFLDRSVIDDMAIRMDVTVEPLSGGATYYNATLGTLPYQVTQNGTTEMHGDYDFALQDADGVLRLSELISLFGPGGNNPAASRGAADDIIFGGFSSKNAAHTAAGDIEARFHLVSDLPAGTALPRYQSDLTLSGWRFTSTAANATMAEFQPTIAFDNTKFELVSFVKDFMGAALTRAEDAMDPLDAIVYLLTNDAFPIISLILGRAPYTSSRSFGGGVEIGDYAGAAEAISRMVHGKNQSGSNFDLFRGNKAYLVGHPGNLLDSWAPVAWQTLWAPNHGWSESFGAMPEALQAVGKLADLTGEAWIDIGGAGVVDFNISAATARTTTGFATPINANARPFGTPHEDIKNDTNFSDDSIMQQVRRLAGNTATPDKVQDAALDFVAAQQLPGRGKFEGFFGGAINQLINVFGGGGVDPVTLPILNDPTAHNAKQSFNLMFGDPSLGLGSLPKDTKLLDYRTPELFLYLYKDIPLDKKKAVEKLTLSEDIYDAFTAFGVEPYMYIAVAFEARGDIGMAFDTTGLDRYNRTRNPGVIVDGFYLDDKDGIEVNGPAAVKVVGSNSDPDEAKILGGVGFGLAIEFNLSIIRLVVGAELMVFMGQVWNLHDNDNSGYDNRIRATEFDVNLDTSVYDRSFVIEFRADVYAKLSIGISIFRVTIVDVRFNLFTLTFDIPFIGQTWGSMPTLATRSGNSLTLTLSNSADNVVYIGAGLNDGEVWVSSGKHSQVFYGITSVTGTSGSGSDKFYISPALTANVTINAGGGADTMQVLQRTVFDAQRGTGTVTFNGQGGNDRLIGGARNDTLDGGDGDDFVWGGDGKDTILGGDGLNTLYGYRGDDHITGGANADTIYGESGDDTIVGGGGNDTLYGGKNNDSIQGGAGTDIVWGGDGRDTLRGGDDADTIHGELGNDYIYGDAGADLIFGEQHSDTIYGGADNDRLDGQGASDRLFGDNGPTGVLLADEGKGPPDQHQDVLISGEGSDYLDGQHDSDTYLITFHGGQDNSLIIVLDTGSAVGSDIFQVTGTIASDDILLRANNDGALAFVALINDADNAERINYIGVERITVSGSYGNDHFVSDDTSAEVTLNGDEGDDTFQIGQVFRSARTNVAANVDVDDEFATIETTRGFLSNGNSAPMTINGGVGADTFTVFHNLAVLTLNGDDGDDTFEVKAFALVGSQEPHRARTDISGGAGADLVQYAVNAPVNIDGGDGFDVLVAIGTEFGDDLVITERGVYGAGLNVSFVNIESLRIDGAEGDDRFFVQSTSEKFVTEIFGGLGDDTFNMSGDTPPVVSNDLLGHSGLITHSVDANGDLRYDDMKLFGVSANVADNDEPGVVIRPTAGSTIIAEGGQTDTYQVVLTRQPTVDILVRAMAPLPTRDQREMRARAFSVSSNAAGAVNASDGATVTLRFTAQNWNVPQVVTVAAGGQAYTDAAGLQTRPEMGDSASFTYDDTAQEGVRYGVINHVVIADVRSVTGQMTATSVTLVSKATEALIEIAGAPSGSYSINIGSAVVTASAGGSASATLDNLKSAFDSLKAGGSNYLSTNDVKATRLFQSTLTITGGVNPGDQFSVVIGTNTISFIVPDSGVNSLAQIASGLALAINAANLTNVTADDRAQNGTIVLRGPAALAGTLSVSNPTDTGAASDIAASAAVSLLQINAEDGDFGTDDSTNMSVSGSFARFNVDGSTGATTVLASNPELNSSLIGRKITVIGGPGAGQQRFVVSISSNSIVTVDRAWDVTDAPTKESSFQIRVDDALVGQPTAVSNSGGFAFTDTSRTFPTSGQGLVGRTLQIVGGPGAGQQRLILANTANTLTLNAGWSEVPTSASIYRIELFDGLALPGVSVQINDNDLAGIIVAESGDGTAVIEGSDGLISGQAATVQAGERDTVTIALTRVPTSNVTVTLTNPDGQLVIGSPTLTFTSANWNIAQTVNLSALNDSVREGFHTGLLRFAITGGDAAASVSRVETVQVSAVAPVFFVGLTHSPASITHVKVGGVTQAAGTYAVDGNKIVFLANGGTLANGQFRSVTSNVEVSYSSITEGFAGQLTTPVLVRIADDDAPTILVRETGGSTDVVEGGVSLLTITHGSSFTADSLIGRTLTIVSGTGSTQIDKVTGLPIPSRPTATIVSNTSNTITVQHNWGTLPDSTSTFTVSSAASGAAISSPGAVTGSVAFGGERDRYDVFLAAGAAYNVDLQGAATSQGTLSDPYLRLYRASDNVLIAQDDDAGVGLNSFLSLTVGASGDYYFTAGAYADAGVGSYRLSFYPMSEIPPGNSTGASLAIGSPVADTVNSNADRDAFRVVLQSGNNYVFHLEGAATGAGSLGDPYLRLLDSAGGVIAQDDDSGAGLNSMLSVNNPTSGVYYLQAGAYNDAGNGSYRLSGEVTPVAIGVQSAVQTNMRSDTYDVVLTAAPTGNVTITVTPEITKTTRTGGIRHDLVQVTLSSADSRVVPNGNGTLTVTFTSANWDVPVVVTATAIDDAVVDGADTQVFAPRPNTLSGILGPVFIEGGGGEGSLGIGNAFILPGETNVKTSTGNVVSYTGANQITVESADLTAAVLSQLGVATIQDLVGKTIEVTRSLAGTGTAIGQFRQILAVSISGANTVFTLNSAFELGTGIAADIQEYALSAESINFFVNESSSVDVMFVHDQDSPADSAGVLTATTLTGFNMGPNGVDGLLYRGKFKPFGITYGGLEVVDITLGRGFNNLKVLGTGTRSDGYRTWTIVRTGDDVPDPNQPAVLGDTVTINLQATDTVTLAGVAISGAVNSVNGLADGRSTVTASNASAFAGLDLRGQMVRASNGDERRILSHTNNTLTLSSEWDTFPSGTVNIVHKADGAFALDAGAGNDTINATGSTLPLVIFGGLGNDNITGGAGDDIIFGDQGRVDYFGEADGAGNRPIVTRLGYAPAPITGLADTPFADASKLNDAQAAFPVPDADDIGLRGLYVWITNGAGFLQDPRLITGNTATSLTVAPNWTVTLNGTSSYRISTYPEDQTDGVVREAGLLTTVNGTQGGNDVISAGAGKDQVFGGAGDDTLNGGDGDDILNGDNGRIDRSRDPLAPVLTVFIPNGGSTVRTFLDRARSTLPSVGGTDTLSGDGGADVLFGGSGVDTLYGNNLADSTPAGDGSNLLFGDHGDVDYTNGTLAQAATTSVGSGAADNITGHGGADFVFGGAGGDTIDAGTGNNVVLGDFGQVRYDLETTTVNLATLDLITTLDDASGGADNITTGGADDRILGGTGNDSINAGAGHNIVLGDSGLINYVLADNDGADIDLIQSILAGGGLDNITVGAGSDIVLGGRFDDSILDTGGSNLVIGDSGRITAAVANTPQYAGVAMTFGLVETMETTAGGIDTITTGLGSDIVLGGFGNDVITANSGEVIGTSDDSANIILGDDGLIDFVRAERTTTPGADANAADIDLIESTSLAADGGNDTIRTGEGSDIIIGGRGADATLNAGGGKNLVIGDSGKITAAINGTAQLTGLAMTLGLIETTQPDHGGADGITAGAGDDIVLGGNAADVIGAGAGNNVVLGDDGKIDFVWAERSAGSVGADLDASDIDLMESSSATANAGADLITTLGGDDILIGGGAGDTTLNAGGGKNLVIGDSGRIISAASENAPQTGVPMTFGLIETTLFGDGGIDTITTTGGDDIVLGGHLGDSINVGDGNNIVFGDDGQIDFVRAERPTPPAHGADLVASDIDLIQSTSTTNHGGADSIISGIGNDILIGGRDGDTTLNADAGNNLVIGDSGRITAANGGLAQLSGLPMTFGLIETFEFDHGGIDIIDTGAGDDIVLGGHQGDIIRVDAGNNIVLGDDGRIDYVVADVDASDIDLIQSLSTTAAGGIDNITSLGGNDLIIAGRHDDTMNAGEGDNLVIGDSGKITATNAGSAQLTGVAMTFGVIETTAFGDGGVDTIDTGGGNDIVLGGHLGDDIEVRNGNNIVLGDDGRIDYVVADAAASDIDLIESLSTTGTNGGADSIVSGSGSDILIGGRAGDTLLNAGDGANLVIGDSGRITAASSGSAQLGGLPLTLGLVETIEYNDGGADTIRTGVGKDIVLGGDDGDTITANFGELAGNDLQNIVLGDNGQINYVVADADAADIDLIESLSTADGQAGVAALGGGIDNITTGGAADIVIAGREDDTVNAGNGANLVIGDSGRITASSAGTPQLSGIALTLGLVETFAFGDGGVDTIDTGTGNDIVLGGHLGDIIRVDAGNNIVLGDDGRIDYVVADVDASDIDLIQSLSTTAAGGIDNIISLGGDDLIIAGRNDDTVNAGDGANLVIGDSGRVTAATQNVPQTGLPLTYGLIETTEFGDGGVDSIDTGTGNDIVLGGHLGDFIDVGAGNNIVLGDDGQIDYAGTDGDAADIDLVASTSTTAAGGSDTITSGAGSDLILGGRFGDEIDTGDGSNLVIGDSGSITAATQDDPQSLLPMTYGQVETTAFGDGGIDDITTGADDDIVLGGHEGDEVALGEGNNVALGDDGQIDYVGTDGDAADIDLVASTSTTAAGGSDTITSGAGSDLILGGRFGDEIDTGDGSNLVIGDSGSITAATQDDPQSLLPMTYGQVETTAFGDGGIDDITTGADDDIVLGGHEGDDITLGEGNNVALGDDGRIDYVGTDGNAADIDLIESTSTTAAGGSDTIASGAGSDLILGGRFGDDIDTGDGSNLVIGDSGSVTAATQDDPQSLLPMTYGLVESNTFGDGGIDDITTGAGNDIVLGGHLGDTITGGDGSNVVLGDDGLIDFVRAERTTTAGADTDASDIDLIESTSTTAAGGSDTIITGSGSDIVIGGRDGDSVNTGDGANLVLGDSGQIEAGDVNAPQLPGQTITLGSIESTQLNDGGSDTITTGMNGDIVLSGYGGDNVTSGEGGDIVGGDNGLITYTNAIITRLETTDTVAQTGGDDTIDAGNGTNLVFGSVGSDTVTTGSGQDIVIGDTGSVTNDGAGNVSQVLTGDPLLGGDDVISTGDGNDVAIGGANNDVITSTGGNDLLVGDGVVITYSDGGVAPLHIQSVDVNDGGTDQIDGGAGNDILIAGQGADTLVGNLTDDLLFGGNAAVVQVSGIVTIIQTDMQDLAAEAMFGQFNASESYGNDEGEGEDEQAAGVEQPLPGSMAELRTVTIVFNQPAPLLDFSAFQRLFNSTVVTTLPNPSNSGSYEGGSLASGQPGGEKPPAQDDQGAPQQQEQGGQQGAPQGDTNEGTGPNANPGSTDEERRPVSDRPSRPVAAAHRSAPRAEEALAKASEHGDTIAAAGLAGLLAGNKAQSRGRGLLDWDAMEGKGRSTRRNRLIEW